MSTAARQMGWCLRYALVAGPRSITQQQGLVVFGSYRCSSGKVTGKESALSNEGVEIDTSGKGKKDKTVKLEICGDDPVEGDEEEMEEMLVDGPKGMEWGGPTRGGRLSEPTRFGDWERNGRCSDF
ncbi:unnamed protein product [Choristocarpus tenellus]